LAVFVGDEDDDDRDPTQPIAFERGRPLYAPRGGRVLRIAWALAMTPSQAPPGRVTRWV
jgi:hypothetical protein